MAPSPPLILTVPFKAVRVRLNYIGTHDVLRETSIPISSPHAAVVADGWECWNAVRLRGSPFPGILHRIGGGLLAQRFHVAVGPAPPPRQHLTSNTRELVERQWSEIYCYDSGTAVDQVWADGCVEDYCGTIQGVQVIGGGDLSMHCQVKDGMSVLMSVTADSGCSFNISTADICIYNFEQPIKECNIGMEKQGGVYSIPGSQWRTDPGSWFGNKTDV
ncbi:hypothetical protein FB45DRAFT_1064963 [Roridomyces roridus]|uniref:Uncharacterized protein n=1 Tax=Roridomyces roridus TaxID=1738132 RepID=A0AAD7FBK2_9AGAR|nr:hypothetical protein FB45DRAFT_1064963 [Roridomyces roridus]